MADRPPPDAGKLLAHWMEWEKGNAVPGDLVKNLKRGGLREFLEEAVAAGPTADPASA
jgi:hypothetical protein